MSYKLTKNQQILLERGLRTAWASPFIDDIEDYIWEAIFAYTKGIPIPDPLKVLRKKDLFDIVDKTKSVGWSLKALQWPIKPKCEFELVIQRADIIKKANSLGFKKLNLNSPTNILGEALLRHWYEKINHDAEKQQVKMKRVCILLKSIDRKKYVYFEEDLMQYSPNNLRWEWTDKTKTGLKGIRKKDNFCVFKWYPNQTQFFERFILPSNINIFEIEPKRLKREDYVEMVTKKLGSNA